MHRNKVYLKVMTSLLSRSKRCPLFNICLQIICVCVCACTLAMHLQKLQSVEAVKHPLRQIGDLISIEHSEKSQHRLASVTEYDTQVAIHAQAQLRAAYRELRERRPWKASGAISEIWLLLRSLC